MKKLGAFAMDLVLMGCSPSASPGVRSVAVECWPVSLSTPGRLCKLGMANGCHSSLRNS